MKKTHHKYSPIKGKLDLGPAGGRTAEPIETGSL